jgi:hypothetical protein
MVKIMLNKFYAGACMRTRTHTHIHLFKEIKYDGQRLQEFVYMYQYLILVQIIFY